MQGRASIPVAPAGIRRVSSPERSRLKDQPLRGLEGGFPAGLGPAGRAAEGRGPAILRPPGVAAAGFADLGAPLPAGPRRGAVSSSRVRVKDFVVTLRRAGPSSVARAPLAKGLRDGSSLPARGARASSRPDSRGGRGLAPTVRRGASSSRLYAGLGAAVRRGASAGSRSRFGGAGVRRGASV